jgi:predicted RNase H-like HicB family nuclease
VVRIHVGEPLLLHKSIQLYQCVANVDPTHPAYIREPGSNFDERAPAPASPYHKVMKKAAMTLSYSVLYEQDSEGGYVAFVPSLPGCHTQGETLEETERNVEEAIELYLESLSAHKEPVPVEDPSFQEELRFQSQLLLRMAKLPSRELPPSAQRSSPPYS